jgi:hypothetical protein
MKYIKTFNEAAITDIAEDIAKDLLPIFIRMKNSGKKITVEFFDEYMKERGAPPDLYHSVMNYLVYMGFNFEISPEGDDIAYGEPYVK